MTERHKEFQFGKNPADMSNFEKSLVAREKMDREIANYKFVRGIQGVDGGCFPGREIKETMHYEDGE